MFAQHDINQDGSGNVRKRRRNRRLDPDNSTAPKASAGANPSVEEVMKHVRAHIEYTIPILSSTVRNLPEFESLTNHGVATQKSEMLWTLEAERMLGVLNAQSGPLLFEDDSLGTISIEGYRMIRDIARRVQCGLMTSLHDNMITMSEHKPSPHDHQGLKMTTWYLQRELNQPAKTQEPDAEAQMLVHCHALINYVTAVFARLLAGTIDEPSWRMTCVAILVKMATKIKIMCRDTRTYASRSLRQGENVRSRQIAEMHLRLRQGMAMSDSEDSDDEGNDRARYYAFSSRRRPSQLDRFRPGEVDDVEFYIKTIGAIRSDFYIMFDGVLENLIESNLPGVPIEAFELSVLLARTSFEKSGFALSQDRRGQIGASAGVAGLHNTSVALQNLHSTIKAIKSQLASYQSKPPLSAREARAQASVRWRKVDGRNVATEDQLDLSNVADIVSVAIAACCTFPRYGIMLDANNKLGNLFHQQALPASVSFPDYTLLFSMSTQAFDDEQPRTTSIGGVRSISSSFIASQSLLTRNENIDVNNEKGQASWLHRTIGERLRLMDPRRKALGRLDESIENSWQFDDDSVTIGCWKYAWTVAAMCSILVGGGLVVGFTVGQRIAGVDPFNITVFCWALAAFILIVAKSARVEDWPWRDFLRGRVVCRSLSELCVVTGEDQQAVLAWLLQNEASTVLQTKGPYNKLFQRRGDWGFSIDCTIELGTMMLSGILVLEVQTQLGPALVCLDVRQGVEYRQFVHSNQVNEGETSLACIEPPPKDNSKVVATLLPMRLGWSSVLGVYNVPTRMFR